MNIPIYFSYYELIIEIFNNSYNFDIIDNNRSSHIGLVLIASGEDISNLLWSFL